MAKLALLSICSYFAESLNEFVNYNLERHKQNARDLLLSTEGIEHRERRPADVETTVGNIKQNKGFRDLCFGVKQKWKSGPD